MVKALAKRKIMMKVAAFFLAGYLAALPVVCNYSANPPSLLGAESITQRRIDSKGKHKLLKPDTRRLIEAQIRGQKEFTLLVAAVPGRNETLVSSVLKLNGKVQYRDDSISYLRVKLPTINVESFASSSDIEGISADGPVTYTSDDVIATSPEGNRIASPNADTPPENPYLPTMYMGAPQFIASHPNFDGRGVTIAIVDTSIDLLTPELQTAKSLDGKITTKIVDVVNAAASSIDPTDDIASTPGSFVVKMEEQHARASTTPIADGNINIAIGERRYRVGSINERSSGPRGDLNRDGNPPGSSGAFAVLWDETTNTVWVDTNQDHSFTDEKTMMDYRIRHDIGIFGKDDPATPIRETIGFTIQTDNVHKLVMINPGDGVHGTAVAGLAVGNGFFGGKTSGAAPQAQIVSVPFMYTQQGISHSLIESIIVAVKHPLVDIVNVSAGVVRVLNDGTSVHSIICNRLVEKFKKPIFASAGNSGDQVNIIQEFATASKVIAVGSYVNRETARVNYGVVGVHEDNVDRLSSRGPAKNGALKPNLLAPAASLTTKPRFLPGEPITNTYALPPGYLVSSGTSAASPMAAGGVALLISAAKQTNIQYDADSLRWAIMSSARYLPNIRAYEQGTGLLQVGAAWEALKNAPSLPEISTSAIITHTFSDELKEPHQGPGIYEREGWTERQVRTRTITFLRTSGSTKQTIYQVRWLGNDGTFSSSTTLTLPLNKPTPLLVKITPKGLGVHSAILSLDEPGPGRAVYQAMNTIVAAEQFTEANQFKVMHEGKLHWMESESFYLNVPSGAAALNLGVQIQHGNLKPWLMSPSGYHYYVRASSLPFSDYQTNGSWSRTIPLPEAGVWQLIVENNNITNASRFAPQNAAIFKLSAAVLEVDTRPQQMLIDAIAGMTVIKKVSFTNRFADVVGGAASLPLGSAYFAQQSLTANGKPVVHQVSVPVGATSLNARIKPRSHDDSDLDLYIFDCTSNRCILKDFSIRKGSSEWVTVANPAAGTWKIIIDPFWVPSGTANCLYEDVFTHFDFGKIVSTTPASLHGGGTKWTEQTSIQIGVLPLPPRQLVALLALRSSSDPDTSDEGTVSAEQNPYYKQALLGLRIIKIDRSSP